SVAGSYSIAEDKLSLTINWNFSPEVGLDYTLELPAGCIVLENGAKNLFTQVKYTVVIPTPDDFTPVVAPAAGDVTIEQIKTTVLSFESPIASFDDSDVRYAKNFGSVWCSVAGSYSIAEDKLSLTINWNFSPEVGLDYTLELPAGCIVLENGAKNLETRIDYTIVASIENGFTYETITPDPSQEVSSIESVVVTFPADVTYDNSLVMLGVNAMTLINTLTVTVEGNTVTFTPAVPITAEGSHQLTWNEGAFTAANGAKCAKATINYTVAKADPNTYNYELAADPANGSTLPALTTINFNDPSFATVAFLTDEAKNTPNWVVVEDAEGNMYSTTLDNTKGVTISVEGATAPGTYSVYVPAKTFYDMMAFSKDGKYNYNPEMRLTYIVKASPLATPTVSPANDTEVENLNTITLTFAEAVTANAEAGAISIVNTSDPNYDYAKEIRVAISEDGLTATITCVPGYLDRWAPGKTYKLNIPAGYFVATSGAASEAIEYSWTIATPKFTYVAVNPAQGEVTELSEILISFAQKTWGNGSNPTLNLVDANGNVVTTASTVRAQDANGNWFAIKATLKDKVTTPGTYKLVVPADVFKDTDLGDGVTNAAFDLTWTVKEVEVDPNTYTLTLNTNPAQGEVTELFKISLSPAGGVFMILATAEAQTENWCKVTDANGNSYNSKIELSGQYYALTIEDATEEGEYTVVIPKKSFYDALNATNFNDEIVLKYEIVAPDNTIYDLAPIAISPANGSKVESLEKIHITFPYGTYDFLWATKEYGKDFIQVSDENGNTYEAKLGYGSYTEDYYIYVKNATALGKYTIVVPKGLVFDEEYSQTFESGHANPEFTLTYTIVAPQVDDFTPVVKPAAGNVTAEQIKTTILSFESPIASFDNSDVRYAKPAFGSVWCSVAGSYTISEDKLSLTINWDFSPEVGLDYTLELPAGCIVLENGAKNLFTQVKYTVVGGPKDLAEFVVPEGINGYINYDETDVNAWAPEFPFTVSTSAINTIQFTAELPSLPAGITAMEVIDENGEVIATLNQDGVAPLADGEIYYVKGETTKEYADGAELKFRFRFTHLGVSETIQFSYKVAGGNITSIADVELDGNVIVRGNDIIAPQGAAIFTVSGIRVPAEGLAPGVYVVVLGNQAVKVMVK
ncbi:MAG: Ig-like domain-containing protein, partial [Muribaculaceae bacterium]|nr:Ig-like domain-containing protein [Muribaculaceae bacterium]